MSEKMYLVHYGTGQYFDWCFVPVALCHTADDAAQLVERVNAAIVAAPGYDRKTFAVACQFVRCNPDVLGIRREALLAANWGGPFDIDPYAAVGEYQCDAGNPLPIIRNKSQ